MITILVIAALGLFIGYRSVSRLEDGLVMVGHKTILGTSAGLFLGMLIWIFGGFLFPPVIDHSFGTPLVIVDGHLGYREEEHSRFRMIDESDTVIADPELFFGEAIIVSHRNPTPWLNSFFLIPEYDEVTILIPANIVQNEGP